MRRPGARPPRRSRGPLLLLERREWKCRYPGRSSVENYPTDSPDWGDWWRATSAAAAPNPPPAPSPPPAPPTYPSPSPAPPARPPSDFTTVAARCGCSGRWPTHNVLLIRTNMCLPETSLQVCYLHHEISTPPFSRFAIPSRKADFAAKFSDGRNRQ